MRGLRALEATGTKGCSSESLDGPKVLLQEENEIGANVTEEMWRKDSRFRASA